MTRTLLALLPFGVLSTACASGVPADSTASVQVGVVIDRSGINSEASWGDAITLAKDHANSALHGAGFTKLQLGVTLTDSANDPTTTVAKSKELVASKAVKALILDTSQNDQAVNKLAYDSDPTNDLNVPLLCGSCTSGAMNNPAAVDPDPVAQASLRNSGGWNFRGVMSTKLISSILEKLMTADSNGDTNHDGVFKVSFYGSDETFGHGAIKDLKSFLPTGTLVEEIYHPQDADPNAYDWAGDLAKLTDNYNETSGQTDNYPDYVVVANFALQQASIIKAAKQANSAIPMLHYHSMRFTSVLQDLGSLADGAEGVSHVLLDDGASGQVFSELYSARFGVQVAYRDAHYYDVTTVAALAAVIATNGKDNPELVTGDSLRAAIPKTSVVGGTLIRTGPDEFAKAIALIKQGQPINYEGASGPMDFDANNNIIGRLARFVVQNGTYVDVQKYDCVASATCPIIP